MRVGDRVKTPRGPGTVRLVVLRPPAFRAVHSVSVELDERGEVRVFAARDVAPPDVLVSLSESFWRFAPQTDEARAWLADNCPGAAWHAGELVCEPRLGPDLTRGMRGAGFVLERP